jgi:NAD+ kinase
MRFIVRAKNGYGEGIRKDVMGILKNNGAEYTEKIEPGCDFAVIIGGDGTLLRDHSEIDCPVLGINPGKSVGFYMLACQLDFRKRILALIKGRKGNDYHVHHLQRLRADVNGQGMKATALNEVLVSPVYVRRLLESRLTAKGKESIEKNSGVIVYTPTGSHAFAHSAGAKTLAYDEKVMGVTALAPYSGTLKKGDILLKDGQVRIVCLCDEGEVSLDGSELHIRKLKKGDVVTVEKGDDHMQLVGFKPKLY